MTTGKQQSPIDVSKFDVIAYTQRFLNVARFVDLCFVSLFDVVAYTQRFLNIYIHTHTQVETRDAVMENSACGQ